MYRCIPPNEQLFSRLAMQSAEALETGGFEAFYNVQVAFFQQYIEPNFNYQAFSQRAGRATQPLQLAEDLLAYNVCYGLDHFNRFTALLDQIATQSNQTETNAPLKLRIYDYGCGQGLATIAMLSHLKDRFVEAEIHLIEPSQIALQAAVNFVRATAQYTGAKIQLVPHQCSLDQLPDTLFANKNNICNIHLFSNVLDIAHLRIFDLSCLARQILSCSGKHVVIAASPDYYSGQLGFTQLNHYLQPNRTFANQVARVESYNYRIWEKKIIARIVSFQMLAFCKNVCAIETNNQETMPHV